MADRLHIASVCRTFPTPADPSSGAFVWNRVAAMARQADVDILQPVPYLPGVRSLPDWARSASRSLEGLTIHQAPMLYVPGTLKRLDGYWLSRSVRSKCAGWHADRPLQAIDAHFGYPEGAGCARVARDLGIPLFITIRGFETEFVTRPDVGPQMMRALHQAAGIVAVSHSLRTLAVEQGVDPARIAVIHNAIDASIFHFRDGSAARARLGIPRDARLVVSVGHLVARKRHHVLLGAFARLAASDPACRLVIVGSLEADPAYRSKLSAEIRQLGLQDRVALLGVVKPAQVAEWLAAADVFALGTEREGCCNAVLEALGVGVPVVTTPAGDNTVFVRDGTNGFVVPVDDVAALADGLARALREVQWDRASISHDLLRQVGSWHDVATRVLGFFDGQLVLQRRGK